MKFRVLLGKVLEEGAACSLGRSCGRRWLEALKRYEKQWELFHDGMKEHREEEEELVQKFLMGDQSFQCTP